MCIKDHVRSSINDFRERIRAITNPSFAVGRLHSPEEGHRSPKVLGKYYSYSTGVTAHGYLRASTSETHAQVSETARTGAAAGHSGESGRERRHAPLRGALPLRGPHPFNNHKINEIESLHVEMYHYVLGNRGIIFPCSSCTTDRYLSQQCIMNEDN